MIDEEDGVNRLLFELGCVSVTSHILLMCVRSGLCELHIINNQRSESPLAAALWPSFSHRREASPHVRTDPDHKYEKKITYYECPFPQKKKKKIPISFFFFIYFIILM